MPATLNNVEPILSILQQQPLGIVSDIDGTISSITPSPEQATVPTTIVRILKELIEHKIFIALISGRDLPQARHMVGLDKAVYVGNHGLSIWENGTKRVMSGTEKFIDLARHTLDELAGLDLPGLIVENKGPAIAFHYRQAKDSAIARRTILSCIEASPSARSFQVCEGRMVVELRPPLDVTKGTALQQLVQSYNLRGLICLGDDITDIDMFQAARKLSNTKTACVAVASDELSPDVASSADYSVNGVTGVEHLLEQVLHTITHRPQITYLTLEPKDNILILNLML